MAEHDTRDHSLVRIGGHLHKLTPIVDPHVQLGLIAGNVAAGRYALYIKNLVLEEKVLADTQASQRLGAGAEEMMMEGGGGEIPNQE